MTSTAPAKRAPSSLVIEDSDAPVVYSRETTENPFAAKVAAMASDWDTETGRSKRSAHLVVATKDVDKYTRKLRDAVRAAGRGVRIKVEQLDQDTSRLRFQLATLKVGAGRKPAAK